MSEEFIPPISLEEINNSFEMKITKKYIKTEYPFIKDIKAVKTNKFFITLSITFDPYEFASMYDYVYVAWFIKCDRMTDALSFGTFFADNPDYVDNRERSERVDNLVREFNKEIEQKLVYFHNYIVPENKRLYAKMLPWYWTCVDTKGVGIDPSVKINAWLMRDRKS